jgi:hypothetical protein
MSEIIKQSMADIWASIGDVVAPDVEKIAEGWLVEVVPRQYWNWMQNRTDTNLAYLFQHGIPEWDATVEYIVNKSYVTYADVVYKAILTGTNKIPSSQPTYWKVAFATSTAALEALKALTPAADKLPYYTGATTAATTTITSLARTLLDDTTQAAMLTTIGAQPLDATLTALAGVTTATNKLPYFSGVDTVTVTDLTAFGRSLIDDADATTARATLGLGTAATLDAVTSLTDSTAGRVVKVGFYGLGDVAGNNSVTDFNALQECGWARANQGSIANAPMDASYNIIHSSSSVNTNTTLALSWSSVTPRAWIRSQNTTYSPWEELWHSGNQIDLGTTATAAKTVLGLENVTNTSDANKPVSTAQQTALNLKANLASPTFTGTPLAPTNASPGNKTTQIATTAFVQSVVNGFITKSVTGGTVTLTADEASNSIIGLLGTLTSNLILEIPVGYDRIFSVSNSTTGAFTVVVKVVGLAPTVLVAQGKRNLIVTSTVGAYDAINDFDAIALTGVSTAATAALGNNTTQIATTAFVNAEIANDAPTKTGGGASGSWGISVTGSSASCTGNAATATTLTGLTPTVTELNFVNGVTSAIQTQLNAKAPIASPTFTGTTGYASLGLGATAVNIDTITGNGVITNVSASTTGTFNGFQGKTGSLITYVNGTSRWQLHNPGVGYLWFRDYNGSVWTAWETFVQAGGANLTGGSVSFSGTGSIVLLRNLSGLTVTRSSAGNYIVNGPFGLQADQPGVAISNNGRIIQSSAASLGGIGFITYPYNTTTPTDSPYVSVILGV